MEEAEALATNVAILGTRMLATGTLNALQEEYGGVYSVRAVRTLESSGPEVEKMLRDLFKGRVINYEDRHRQIRFNLPHERAGLGSVLKTMELLKGANIEDQQGVGIAVGGSSDVAPTGGGLLEDYIVNRPTLEEVFMNVAREAGTAQED